ncbi:hybrid sensor histidine kinase/response regulator [Kovacikia minuta CCNUW1]|uniref:hybrid sensor histidine kinase/response regulator n=1 Tax=Kovacikia minuta TaxID=2931930 RepID=UPI001CD01790|nr:hybrid sensor histidine kinase/response regulator [Kovacikia minuta]UBF27942.1 hybrid sensor histidine kinase/response regulator [Kovacikia minuta CCNUW1]
MPVSATVHPEDYANFRSEASDLLQTIEQELFNLKADRTAARVHALMRSAHTLKGSAASIQLETVKSVAHALEDVFRALYNPEIVIDAELEALLFQAYECLRLPLIAEFTGSSVDEADVLGRTTAVLSQLQTKLGDLFDQETPIPTSAELGFDMVQSMFEGGVEQRLQALEQALAQLQSTLAAQLQTEAEVFLGLAESVQLVGFAAIAQTTLAALAAHPDQVSAIAALAIADFRQGQAAILAGDRTQGGTPSPALKQFTQVGNPRPNPIRTNGDKVQFSPNGQSQQLSDGNPRESLLPPPTSGNKLRSVLQWLKDFFTLEPTGQTDRVASPPTASPAAEPRPSDPFEFSLDALFDASQPETSPTPTPPQDDGFPSVSLLPLDLDLEPIAPVAPAASLPTPTPDFTPAAIASPLPDLSVSEVSSTADSPAPVPVVRVKLGQLERLDYLAGELLINQNQQTTQDDRLRLATQELLAYLQKHKRTLSNLQSWSDLTLATDRPPASVSPGVMADFDALELDRYTDFHVLVQSVLNDLVQLELIGESLETQIRQVRQVRETQKRLLTSLQDDLTTARMQPLGETLNRLPRVLQQLASAHAKPVELTLTGTFVLVDKAIAEKLYNPLLHLVRNAFDHGIEPPDLRRAKGKPETGQIQIHAYHQGNRTLIEIRDDGQGIDWQRVAATAIDNGLVSPEDAANLSPSQLAEFLFQAGFSTATQVSDLSGRGVGLDMVRSETQALQGTISVSSVAGQGSTFTLSLPMSFSITRLMVCQAQGIPYALPINTIQQVVLPRPDQLVQTSGQQRVLRWHSEQGEQMVPVRALSQLLHYPDAGSLQQDASSQTPIILLRAGKELWGLRVDQVVGEQELVIRPLGTAIAPPPYVYGCSMLTDRQMALVVDPILLQQSWLTSLNLANPDRAASIPSAVPPTPPARAQILLIEDSLTVRHSLARTLQEQGYRVAQAGDGLEAFAFLQQDPDVHLIISDIEMPRMNGFEFLSQLRKTPAWQTIPVVLLTSRSGSKYRQLATELGANAFINKPYTAEVLLPLLSALIKPAALVSNSL